MKLTNPFAMKRITTLCIGSPAGPLQIVWPDGRMKISPIYFSSDFTVLLGIYYWEIGLLSLVFIFSRMISFLSFWIIDCFFAVFLLGLLPTLGRDELLFNFFALTDFFRLFFDIKISYQCHKDIYHAKFLKMRMNLRIWKNKSRKT